ncbi:MAG: flagellar hook-basal body protein [Lachnospiraceae bacterium]|jgi:flagellar basal-body rod protein FlgF|nr:flagellar hook-basal body protein [Lachnospiraceae bacterium]MCI9397740.1 flagellar hook-basal body protein [Lachnospiraceae bacterium]
MLKGLYTAYTGMLNEQHRMDVLTNNLANATTNGFKKEGTTSEAFDTVLAYKIKDLSEPGNLPRPMATNRAIDQAEANNPLNENYMERRVRKTGLNLGVKIGENYVDYSEGPIKETGNTLDLALSDRGFFAIEYTNKAGVTSTKYTRDGNFTMNQQGFLQTQDGDYVLDEDGQRIQMDPALPISISRNGTIVQDGAAVATIGITDFEDYNYLERFGENFFQPVEGAVELDRGETGVNTQIHQGYLEMSNISVVTEMVNMITLQRQYESNQKVITTYDDTLEQAVTQNGKI